MARDYEDFSSIDDLDDDELAQLIRDRLAENSVLSLDDFHVEVENGEVRLTGQVGTEEEYRIAEHVLTDVVGLKDFDNGLLIDPNRRASTPEDIEDHLVVEAASSDYMLGQMPPQDMDEVDQARGDEDLDERMFGTTNYQDAVAHGTTYIPPEGPTPEGRRGTDAGPAEYSDDH